MTEGTITLITGATGHVGGKLAEILAGQGREVRAFVRDRGRAAKLPAGVGLAVGDLDDEASVNRAVSGADAIFHMQSSHGTDQTAIMIRAAKRAGVKKIVALSSIGAVLEPMAIMGTWFHAREELLRASGLDVTYLRPNSLMPNALWWARSIKESGTVTDPCGDGRISCVDTDDVARIAAVVLTQPGHEGHGYILTGPEALTDREQAGILADVLGRSIDVVDVTPQEFADASVAQGMPAEAAAAMRDLNETVFRVGRCGILTDDIQNVTGHKPGTFRAWCERNAGAFA